MITHFCLGVAFLAALATAVADPGIKVVCAKDSVRVTWKVAPQFVPYAARFFLGSCMPSGWKVLPNGEGEATFNYKFYDCRFTKQLKGKHIIYQNRLSFRPQAKPKPAIFTYPINCVQKRPEQAKAPQFLDPGTGVSEGHSKLVFHMELLNEQLTEISKTNVIPIGSFMPIWAAVEQKSHQPLTLLMDECVAASTPDLQPGSQIYPLVVNHGCLLESKRGSALFLPRYHSSAIVLYLQSFKFGMGEVYIHCNLIVWDPDSFDQRKKACHVKDGSWELLDDPNQSFLCNCCETSCGPRRKRAAALEPHGKHFNSVLGPIVIVDQPGSMTNASLPETAAAGVLESLHLS